MQQHEDKKWGVKSSPFLCKLNVKQNVLGEEKMSSAPSWNCPRTESCERSTCIYLHQRNTTVPTFKILSLASVYNAGFVGLIYNLAIKLTLPYSLQSFSFQHTWQFTQRHRCGTRWFFRRSPLVTCIQDCNNKNHCAYCKLLSAFV